MTRARFLIVMLVLSATPAFADARSDLHSDLQRILRTATENGAKADAIEKQEQAMIINLEALGAVLDQMTLDMCHADGGCVP